MKCPRRADKNIQFQSEFLVRKIQIFLERNCRHEDGVRNHEGTQFFVHEVLNTSLIYALLYPGTVVPLWMGSRGIPWRPFRQSSPRSKSCPELWLTRPGVSVGHSPTTGRWKSLARGSWENASYQLYSTLQVTGIFIEFQSI